MYRTSLNKKNTTNLMKRITKIYRDVTLICFVSLSRVTFLGAEIQIN